MRINKILAYAACLAALFLLHSKVLAQTDYTKLEFDYYTTAHGLPDDFTSGIIQDKIGYIWIGTKNGLSRFDGYAFKNFEKNQEPIKLRSDRIVELKNLDDSLTGILTLYGYHVLNNYSYKSRFFRIEDTTALSVYLNSVKGFEKLGENYAFLSAAGFYEFDPAGRIIFSDIHQPPGEIYGGSPKSKLLKIDSGRVIIYSAKKGVELYNSAKKQLVKLPSPLVTDGVNALSRFSDPKTIRKQISPGEYLFVPLSKDSIYYLDIEKNILRSSPLPFVAENELLVFINRIYELGKNEFALTSKAGGFFSFSLSADKHIHFNPKRYLPTISCTSLLKDREGRLWVCSVNGLYKQKNVNTLITSFKIPMEKPEKELLAGLHIVGDQAFIDALTYEYLIVDIRKNEIKHKLRFYNNDPNWNSIGTIQNYYQDTLWISTLTGILWLDMKRFTYGKVPIPEIMKNIPLYMGAPTPDGKAWICGYYQQPYVCYDLKKRTFTLYNDTTAVKAGFIKATGITCDSYGDVWFYGYGLSRWNNRLQKFDTVIKDFGKTGEFKQLFSFVRPDDHGSLWIGVNELGLIEYNIRTKKVTLYESINSASLDYIQTSSPIINDKLWLSLTNKLVCLNVKTKEANVYSQVEYLPRSVSAPNGFSFDQKTNTFYAAAGNDLIIKFKNEVPRSGKKEILISELDYDETHSIYHPKDTVRLKHYQNSISVYFDALDFNLKYPQKFKYRIDRDSVWRTAEQKQPVFMYNLDKGWHTVNIKFDYDNAGDVHKTLYIFIEPPFWKTTWFYLLVVITLLVGAYLVISGIIKRARNKNKINFQLKEFEFKALHAQMNPHFIFNSLNSIKALIMYNRNTEASQYLNKFSSLVRQNLDHSRKPFLTLQQNIDYIRQYIEIEAIRFKDLQSEIITDPTIDTAEIKIAPMLLQPLIENAIWHGLQTKKGHKVITIRFRADASRIICEIEDNGIGINNAQAEKKIGHTSIGIENIRQRIALLNEKYHMNYILEITDKSEINAGDTGTLVILSFNYF